MARIGLSATGSGLLILLWMLSTGRNAEASSIRSTRPRTSNFSSKLETWNFMVRTETFSFVAISLLLRFCAIFASTSRCRRLNGNPGNLAAEHV